MPRLVLTLALIACSPALATAQATRRPPLTLDRALTASILAANGTAQRRARRPWTPRQKGAYVGALLGATAGGVVGYLSIPDSGCADACIAVPLARVATMGAGMAVGALVGGVAGYFVGGTIESHNDLLVPRGIRRTR